MGANGQKKRLKTNPAIGQIKKISKPWFIDAHCANLAELFLERWDVIGRTVLEAARTIHLDNGRTL